MARYAISCLSGLSHDRLGFEGAGGRHGLTFRTIESRLTLIASWVRHSVELRIRAEVASSAVFSDDTGTAVITSGTLLAVFVTSVHEGTSRANRLTLLICCAD